MVETALLRIAIGCSAFLLCSLFTIANDRPNVVLIVCDDLNDSVEGFGGHPQAQTPHMDRLAQTGVRFQCAYTNNPICAPSRASFLTGIYPHTSGNLFWNKWYENPVLKNSRTMMDHFRKNDYQVVGTGKIMHFFRRKEWDEFGTPANYGPFPWNGKKRVGHPSVPKPFRNIGPIDGSFGSLADIPYGGKNGAGWVDGSWKRVKAFKYNNEGDRDKTPDEKNAAWAANFISSYSARKKDKPFFLAVGFIRPHTPMHAPQKYFDKFPLRDVQLPSRLKDDAHDTHYHEAIPPKMKNLSKGHRYYNDIRSSYGSIEAGLRAYTQAYLACVAAVDECVGQVVDAVDASPYRDNTIVIVTSDHGFNLGEKDYLFKNSPWEESCRVPLIVRAPGVSQAGSQASHPVSLVDLYPTLIDLCGLQGDTRKSERGLPLDGHSIRPFLQDPASSEWSGPKGALTMIYGGKQSNNELARQHWSYRTTRWRYILYGNGCEELYDHFADPFEWKNLIGKAEHFETAAALRKELGLLLNQ